MRLDLILILVSLTTLQASAAFYDASAEFNEDYQDMLQDRQPRQDQDDVTSAPASARIEIVVTSPQPSTVMTTTPQPPTVLTTTHQPPTVMTTTTDPILIKRILAEAANLTRKRELKEIARQMDVKSMRKCKLNNYDIKYLSCSLIFYCFFRFKLLCHYFNFNYFITVISLLLEDTCVELAVDLLQTFFINKDDQTHQDDFNGFPKLPEFWVDDERPQPSNMHTILAVFFSAMALISLALVVFAAYKFNQQRQNRSTQPTGRISTPPSRISPPTPPPSRNSDHQIVPVDDMIDHQIVPVDDIDMIVAERASIESERAAIEMEREVLLNQSEMIEMRARQDQGSDCQIETNPFLTGKVEGAAGGDAEEGAKALLSTDL